MPLFLKERRENLSEKMDQPDCDQELLFNTYRQFYTINHLISGWQRIYKNHIRPLLTDASKVYSIADIGCGGGDIIRLLDHLTREDGLIVEFTGIEPDDRAIQYVTGQEWPENISFLETNSGEMIESGYEFDIVISNHLIHHLTNNQLRSVCSNAREMARIKVIFNDIERSDIGYASFRLAATPLFRNSYIVEDGLTSIKRSFRKHELQQVLPKGWVVQRQIPFRLLAMYNAQKS